MPHPGTVSVGRLSKAPPNESCFCTSSLDSEVLVSVSRCSFLDAPGKAPEGLLLGFCARVIGNLMLKMFISICTWLYSAKLVSGAPDMYLE